jgi:hypothetical protein
MESGVFPAPTNTGDSPLRSAWVHGGRRALARMISTPRATPRGLRETSPHLGCFLLLGRGSYEDVRAIHLSRIGGGVRGLLAVFCANRVRSTRL